MNITFFIGNGFDIGLGLHTRYEDFYNESYCKFIVGDNDNIMAFKSMLRERNNNTVKKIQNWADFEKAFGEHSSDFSDINEKYKYLERFEDFIRKFNAYLENEYKNIDYSNKNLILTTMINGINSYFQIRTADTNQILKLYEKKQRERINYNFISFNYTKTIDECLKIVKKGSTVPIGKIVHIHGLIEDTMITGVNDASQITNKIFSEDPDVLNELVKPLQNESSRTNHESETLSIINSSDIICIYGMSIGATDKKWWNYISKWLSASKERYLVILTHDTDYDKRFPFTQSFATRTLEERFLSYSELPDNSQQAIKNQMFFGFNYDVFSMNLRKGNNSEEDENGVMDNVV